MLTITSSAGMHFSIASHTRTCHNSREWPPSPYLFGYRHGTDSCRLGRDVDADGLGTTASAGRECVTLDTRCTIKQFDRCLTCHTYLASLAVLVVCTVYHSANEPKRLNEPKTDLIEYEYWRCLQFLIRSISFSNIRFVSSIVNTDKKAYGHENRDISI